LKRAQIAAARLICQQSHVNPSHRLSSGCTAWLPVKQRMQYKLCTIMYGVHHGLAPSCISELMTSVAAQTSRPRLRSESADTILTMFNLGYGRSSENALYPMPALLHGTRYRMNFNKHRLSTASNATSRLIFFSTAFSF